ncbi:hypothetical protein M408DRAFT_332976 [Serendipita vermifera MAFF 305830]|uniref:Uncharacterized protein n=1 Tax=Serendipita vermifera MAFF 305830 TaxID=933852 RepID=A0A0C3AQD6_SERVB|nr:hypothetical protein M408DRAFT_332976 [Serendipita vermifera MAFF 305830]
MSQENPNSNTVSDIKDAQPLESPTNAGEGPVAPQDEHVVHDESAPSKRKPFAPLPTREQIIQAQHKGSGGGARIPRQPPSAKE